MSGVSLYFFFDLLVGCICRCERVWVSDDDDNDDDDDEEDDNNDNDGDYEDKRKMQPESGNYSSRSKFAGDVQYPVPSNTNRPNTECEYVTGYDSIVVARRLVVLVVDTQ